MTSIISELGRAVSDRWKTRGYAEWEFSSLAALELQAFGLDGQIERIFDHVFVDCENLLLKDHQSAEVTNLYSTAHFSIYLHIWINGLAPLHHHAWSGAYQLLRGSSVDAKYSFLEERRLAMGLSIGRLQCRTINDVSVGTVQPVEPGPDNIHGLSYNDPVGMAISIRSRRIADEKSTDYWHPGVAIDTGVALDYQKVQRKCIQYLMNVDSSELLKRLRDLVTTGNLCSIFLGLEALCCGPMRISGPDWVDLVELGTARHGSIFEAIALAARESGRPLYHRRLAARIGREDAALRHFLSNLFVCPNRETLLSRLSTISGDVALFDKCREWCRRILSLDSGYDILDNEIGLAEVLGSLVSTASIEGTLDALSTRYEMDDATLLMVRGACEHLMAHPVLTPLFR